MDEVLWNVWYVFIILVGQQCAAQDSVLRWFLYHLLVIPEAEPSQCFTSLVFHQL